MPIFLSDSARAVIFNAGATALPVETGGLLVGVRIGHRDVYAHEAVVVQGPRGPAHYVLPEHQREAALQAWFISNPADAMSGFVGFWHTHPKPSGPSLRDHLTLRKRASDTGDTLAMLVAARYATSWELHGRVSGGRWVRAAAVEIT